MVVAFCGGTSLWAMNGDEEQIQPLEPVKEQIQSCGKELRLELDHLKTRENRLLFVLKCGEQIITYVPVVIFYYQNDLPSAIFTYVSWYLSPISWFLTRKNTQHSVIKTSLLNREMTEELEKFIAFISELDGLIDKISALNEKNKEDFLYYLSELGKSNKVLEDFFVDLQLKLINNNRGSTEVNTVANTPLLRKIITIYTLIKMFKNEQVFLDIKIKKPSLNLGIFEGWDFSFHSYDKLLELVSAKFCENIQEIIQMKKSSQEPLLAESLKPIFEILREMPFPLSDKKSEILDS